MKFELPELGYAYDALEPTIGEETMRVHHDKHHKTYVDNLNKAIDGLEFDFEVKCACSLLKHLDEIPENVRTAVRNNAGGHANHLHFWETMKPGGSKTPQGALAEAIDKDFGSLDELKKEFEAKGAGRFGSGWVWLVYKDGKLEVVSTPNQDSPVTDGYKIIFGNDVWEHAYYLNYQNRRADYLKAWWDVVNWDVVGERFDNAVKAGA